MARTAYAILLIAVILIQSLLAKAQADKECNIMISGTILDRATGEPLQSAIIRVMGGVEHTHSDNDGHFTIGSICNGPCNLIVVAQLYYSDTLNLVLNKDTTIKILLTQKSFSIDSISVVTSRSNERSPLTRIFLDGNSFDKTIGESLGESLKEMSGITTYNTGTSISKPVIHGMSGNRVLILNNGVRQEGQQWGSEHAPEIDPMIGRSLEVIKGASSVRYGQDAISGVILVNPEGLPYGMKLSGELDVVGFSNGYEGVVSGMMESGIAHLPELSWRLQGTLKKSGNVHTPDYTLLNTGFEEANFSISAGYRKNDFGVESFFSSFNSKIGIFSGSHIGNLTDLEQAFSRSVPFDTGSFSYSIDRPYQMVSHNLFKANTFLIAGKSTLLKASYAYQKNDRSEFDKHGNDPEKPELYFSITTQTIDITSDIQFNRTTTSSFGLTGITQTNIGEGRPLIPNFRNYGIGTFYIHKWRTENALVEAGIRYDYKWQRIYMYENNVLISPAAEYSNLSGTAGFSYDFTNDFRASVSIGTSWRPPNVSELYSNGLHHGSASIEIGNSSLSNETSFNTTATMYYDNRQDLSASLTLYTNQFGNLIYLEPRLPATLTIRGAFPTYYYSEGKAYINGIDFDFNYRPVELLEIYSRASLLRAYNRSANDYLPLMPPDRIEAGITFHPYVASSVSDAEVGLSLLSVAKQTRVPMNISDYAPAPPGYNLLNLNARAGICILGSPVDFELIITNLLNTSYRDYLNRFRYFTDEIGRNISLKIIIPFSSK